MLCNAYRHFAYRGVYDEENPNGREYTPVTFVNEKINYPNQPVRPVEPNKPVESSKPDEPSKPVEESSEPTTPSEPVVESSEPSVPESTTNPPTGMNGIAGGIVIVALSAAGIATVVLKKKR